MYVVCACYTYVFLQSNGRCICQLSCFKRACKFQHFCWILGSCTECFDVIIVTYIHNKLTNCVCKAYVSHRITLLSHIDRTCWIRVSSAVSVTQLPGRLLHWEKLVRFTAHYMNLSVIVCTSLLLMCYMLCYSIYDTVLCRTVILLCKQYLSFWVSCR